MKSILKNRLVISVICLVLAALVMFIVIPRQYQKDAALITVVHLNTDVILGQQITEAMVSDAQVGGYGRDASIITDKAAVIGKYATQAISKNDDLYPSKLSDTPVSGRDAIKLQDGQCLVTVSMDNGATGAGGYIEAGNLVDVFAYEESDSAFANVDGGTSSGSVVSDSTLTNLEVYSVQNSSMADIEDIKEQVSAGVKVEDTNIVPSFVTLVVTEAQASSLINMEYKGTIHLVVKQGG